MVPAKVLYRAPLPDSPLHKNRKKCPSLPGSKALGLKDWTLDQPVIYGWVKCREQIAHPWVCNTNRQRSFSSSPAVDGSAWKQRRWVRRSSTHKPLSEPSRECFWKRRRRDLDKTSQLIVTEMFPQISRGSRGRSVPLSVCSHFQQCGT